MLVPEGFALLLLPAARQHLPWITDPWGASLLDHLGPLKVLGPCLNNSFTSCLLFSKRRGVAEILYLKMQIGE